MQNKFFILLVGVLTLGYPSSFLLMGHNLEEQLSPASDQRSQLINLLTGSIISRTLYSLAELHVADQVTTTPLHVNILAQKVGAHPEALYRALRLAAS